MLKIEWNEERSAAKVTRRSILSGRLHSRVIAPLTPGEVQRWQDGEPIQDVMPLLSAEDREFLISGATPEEWEGIIRVI